VQFSPYSQHLTKQALNGFGNLKIRGKVICNTKYTNYLVVLAKEETMPHSMINKLIEIESCACGKNKGNDNLKKTIPVHMTDWKQLENVEYLNRLGSMITYDARCTCDIKSVTATIKQAFNRGGKKTFRQQTGHGFKGKKL
jgi:hypothetical protein